MRFGETCHAGGREFESRRPRQFSKWPFLAWETAIFFLQDRLVFASISKGCL